MYSAPLSFVINKFYICILFSSRLSMSRCCCFIVGGLDQSQGLYECQVNTEPKINWPVTVHVEGKLSHGLVLLF